MTAYKGMTVPAYSDAADAPKAFQDLVDSGPIPRFADATARNAAITTPVEGQLCYLNDTNDLLLYDGATWGTPWLVSTDFVESINFSVPSELEVKTGTARWYPPFDCTIQNVSASVGTAPVGGTGIYVDVNKNGTTIFTGGSGRPFIAETTFFDLSGLVSISSLTTADYLTVDIDQIGSTTPGSDLVVQVRYKRA